LLQYQMLRGIMPARLFDPRTARAVAPVTDVTCPQG
jgi:hypothetical protein